ESDFLTSDDKKKFLSWNPFENKSTDFFDSEIQFGTKFFDIVIGNPPYGAKISAEDKKYFKENYKYANQGSLDTYKIFIEKGFNLLDKNGNLNFIVPMSVTSSLSNAPLHKMILENCELIKISSYGYRPNQIFRDAATNVSVISFVKSKTRSKKLLTTKINKRYREEKIQDLIDNLKFVNSLNLLKEGRIPKISYQIEADILNKLYSIKTTIADLLNETKQAKPIYYRTSGGLYYKIVTSFSTNSSKETLLLLKSKYSKLIGAIMSSTLYYWRWLINSNWLDMRSYEILDFPIPIDKFTDNKISEIEKIYKEYEKDLIKNSKPYRSKGEPAYYGKLSKHIIDKIDRLICPLYGLTEEEMEFIIGYELEFRV
ncbi:DNA modification methylase, partial [Brachyspira aalborgi]|uniref:Eco57I restriction-modification methylase domain-containing protein n=1 Tax=Brachyspira aalborgi TaxID=29522 RepID=UPI0012586536